MIKGEQKVAVMAAAIKTNGQLRRIVMDAKPHLRQGVFEMISKYVMFKVSGSLKRRFSN